MHKLTKATLFAGTVLLGAAAISTTHAQSGALPATAASVGVPTGSYQLDPAHASIIARIAHGGGISFSTFRINTVSGNLAWNPAKPETSSATVTAEPGSIASVVPTFGQELAGARFLNAAKFPTAQFVSKSIRVTGANAGVISGDLNLMGVTRPIEVQARLVGAGKDFRGNQVIGFSGTTKFNRSDFGMTTMMGPIGNEVELVLDLEFKKAPTP